MSRTFEARDAVREQVPVLVGLFGPSGSGKTFSALRLATGMQAVVGGDIYGIDTEAGRMLHYADRFRFKHVPFRAPFGALDYLAALKFCVDRGARVIVVDSMSHEHEGPGGMLDAAEEEMKKLAGDDYGTWKADRYKMQSWIKPKAARRALINGMLQLNANFVFCFRAKETVRPVKVKNAETGRSKTEIVPQGFMPIAGEEFLFEQTVNCLLPPHSDGVPQWESDLPGERMLMKLPEQFKALFPAGRTLDETLGRALAAWARGGQVNANPRSREAAAASSQDAVGLDAADGVRRETSAPFSFQAKAASGKITFVADGQKWADGLIKHILEPADLDQVRARWRRNQEYVEAAYAAGHIEHARRVEAAFKQRERGVAPAE